MRREIYFPEASNQDIIDALFANSFVFLRSFVDPEILVEIRAALPTEGSPEDEKLISFVGDNNLANRVFGPQHRQLLEDIAADFTAERIRPLGTSIRRMRAPATLSNLANKSTSLAPHMDGAFTGMDFMINFWIPLDDCGTHSPSLSVFDMNFDEVSEFLGCGKAISSAEVKGGMDTSRFRPGIRDIFTGVKGRATDRFRRDFQDRIWHPPFQAGDCMLMTNWTIHETYQTPWMTKPRDSMEMRFRIGESLAAMLKAHGLPA